MFFPSFKKSLIYTQLFIPPMFIIYLLCESYFQGNGDTVVGKKQRYSLLPWLVILWKISTEKKQDSAETDLEWLDN
jgi:hypothetical protein